MLLQVRIIEENEIIDDELEFLDETALIPIDQEAKNLAFEIVKQETAHQKPSTEPINFNATLAEISVIEGTELLAAGNYEAAVERFRDAIKYDSNNKQYQTKLLEALEKTKPAPLANTKKTTSKLEISPVSSAKSTVNFEIATDDNPTFLKDTQAIAIHEGLKETQEVSINDTLGEMSFIEANDLLAAGNYPEAIERFKEAIKYCPKNSSYTERLNQVLAESKQQSKTAALKALKEETFEETEEVSSKKNTKKLKKALNETLEAESPISLSTGGRKPQTSKSTFFAIVATIVVICLSSLYYQFKAITPIEVTLSYPSNQAKINKNQLEFEWHSVGDRFLFEIESLGKPIVSVYTEETRYKLTATQTTTIKTEINYKWRVTPVDFKGEPLPNKVEEKWFEVVQ